MYGRQFANTDVFMKTRILSCVPELPGSLTSACRGTLTSLNNLAVLLKKEGRHQAMQLSALAMLSEGI